MVLETQGSFDAAHMLSNYEGKCNNLHGHTYHYAITIHAPASVTTGMVMDFNTVKEVIAIYDHATIFASADYREESEEQLCGWAIKYRKKTVIMNSGKPTAENMANEIANLLYTKFDHKEARIKVQLWETPKNSVVAEVACDSQEQCCGGSL